MIFLFYYQVLKVKFIFGVIMLILWVIKIFRFRFFFIDVIVPFPMEEELLRNCIFLLGDLQIKIHFLCYANR